MDKVPVASPFDLVNKIEAKGGEIGQLMLDTEGGDEVSILLLLAASMEVYAVIAPEVLKDLTTQYRAIKAAYLMKLEEQNG